MKANTFDLIESDTFLYPVYVLIEARALSHVGEIGKDKSLFHIEAQGNDVLRVFPTQSLALLLLHIFPQKLFIVSQLND